MHLYKLLFNVIYYENCLFLVFGNCIGMHKNCYFICASCNNCKQYTILQLLIYVSMTLKLFPLIIICSLAVYVETVFNINYLNGIYKFYEILNWPMCHIIKLYIYW